MANLEIKNQADKLFKLLSKQNAVFVERAKLFATIAKEDEKLRQEGIKIEESVAELRFSLGEMMKNSDETSVDTKNYTATCKVSKDVLSIIDDEVALKWVKNQKGITNKDYIKVKESLDKVKFKKLAQLEIAKGNEVEGVKVEDSYSVSIKIKS